MSDKVYEVYCHFVNLGGVELVGTFDSEEDANDFKELQESESINSYFVEAIE